VEGIENVGAGRDARSAAVVTERERIRRIFES
jgi:hypothetical protein